jgi:hypothetical protein
MLFPDVWPFTCMRIVFVYGDFDHLISHVLRVKQVSGEKTARDRQESLFLEMNVSVLLRVLE